MPAAKEYTTTKRNGCVKLRKEESGLGSEEPISVPTLLQDAAAAYPDVSHFIQPILSKGQTISEWIYEVIVSPKIRVKNCQDFCPV